jgi:hypothetical protein
MIGSLLYLFIYMRPDIVFIVSSLTYYFINFLLEYIKTTKRIFCYFQGIIFIKIIYKKKQKD